MNWSLRPFRQTAGKHALGLLLISLTLVHYANADAGTPLMLLTAGHLVFGNLIIGIIEGLVLARLFGISKGRALAWIIPANYFSAILGLGFVYVLPDIIQSISFTRWIFYHLNLSLALLVTGSFLVSVVAESPFCWAALRKLKSTYPRAILASLILQSASYMLLLPIYFHASVNSLTHEFKMDPEGRISSKNPSIEIFYLSSGRRTVDRIRLDGSGHEVVWSYSGEIPTPILIPKLENGKLSLWAEGTSGKEKKTLRVASLDGSGSSAWRRHLTEYLNESASPERMLFEAGLVGALQFGSGDWVVHAGVWSAEGVLLRNDITGQRFNLAVEMPGFWWQARSATMLPHDQAIVQLGPQIVLIDILEKKTCFITSGMSPFVVLN